jgi:hypothetical protein
LPSSIQTATALTRRSLLQREASVAGAGLLQACGTPTQPATITTTAHTTMPMQNHEIALLACSGTLPNALQRQHGVERLQQAGFSISNAVQSTASTSALPAPIRNGCKTSTS